MLLARQLTIAGWRKPRGVAQMRTNTLRTASSRNAKIPVSILARNSLANAYLVQLLLKEPHIRLLRAQPLPSCGQTTQTISIEGYLVRENLLTFGASLGYTNEGPTQ
jgi:hypothetical protein